MRESSRPPRDEHRVAITEEAIACRHCMTVSLEHRLASGEGAHQHQKTRFRQMEVGEQHIDHLEAKTRCDEEPRLTRPGRKILTLRASECRRLERPYDRGADRDHATA